MALHYENIRKIFGGCPVVVATGNPETGKSTSMKAVAALYGQWNLTKLSSVLLKVIVAKFMRRDWDNVQYRSNVSEACTRFYWPHPFLGDSVLPHLLSLCLCHTSICAIELDCGTMLQNQVNRDIGPKTGTVPPKSGHLATMQSVLLRLCLDIGFMDNGMHGKMTQALVHERSSVSSIPFVIDDRPKSSSRYNTVDINSRLVQWINVGECQKWMCKTCHL